MPIINYKSKNYYNEFMFDTCLLYDHNYYNSDLRSDYKTFQSYLYFGNINSEHLYIVYGGSTSSTIMGLIGQSIYRNTLTQKASLHASLMVPVAVTTRGMK